VTIMDLTSNQGSSEQLRKKLRDLALHMNNEGADLCYQCGRCTSGCEAMKLLELEPHKIAALIRVGFGEELIDNEIIWTCMTCLKCKERCPQNVAPVDLIYLLKNLAISQGKQVPGDYTNQLQNVMATGLLQAPKDVAVGEGSANRQSLGLPEISKPEDPGKFGQYIMAAATQAV